MSGAAARGLNADEAAILETARRYAREKIAPGYMAREKAGRIEREIVRGMGGLGLIAPELPESAGGYGLSSLLSGMIAEAIGHADMNAAYIQILASLNGAILARHASKALQEEWLPGVIAGGKILCIGLTEPRGGSDAANLALSARRDGAGYILKGEKSSISMASQADAIIVFARTGRPVEGARGVSAFLVPMNAPGVSTSVYRDFGSHAIGRSSVYFDDVRVPEGNRIAEEGAGFIQVMQGFDFSRALIGLQVLGAAQASLDETWAYAKERKAFGAPLAANQGVTFPLAEAEAGVAAARALCHHTLALRDAGAPHTAEAAMCKFLAPKTAVEAIHQCLLTHGHYGWSMDLPHQQRLRDVMGLEIGDGTAQIMKMIVAREKLKGR